MRPTPSPFVFLFLCFSLTLGAQDVHFTLHDYNPLWLNPAQTGGFSGTARVGGIYRGQWYSLNGISTPSAYVDAPVVRGLRKYDWIGVGALLVSDNSGDLNLKSNFFGFSAAYHLALDNKRQNVLTLGAQYGSTSYGLEVDGVPVQQINIPTSLGGGGMVGQSEFPQAGGNNPNGNNDDSYNDINVGLMLRSVMDAKKNNRFEVGISMYHLNSPERETLTMTRRDTMMNPNPNPGPLGNADTRKRRPTLHAHAKLDLEMSEKWRFQPSVFAQNSAGNTSISLQAWGSRALKPNLDLRLGLGYRTADAAQVLVGFDFERIRAALSYDITLSQARSVDNYQGGFELAAAYIFSIYKKPTVVPTMLCPKI